MKQNSYNNTRQWKWCGCGLSLSLITDLTTRKATKWLAGRQHADRWRPWTKRRSVPPARGSRMAGEFIPLEQPACKTCEWLISGVRHLVFQTMVDGRELAPWKWKPWGRGCCCTSLARLYLWEQLLLWEPRSILRTEDGAEPPPAWAPSQGSLQPPPLDDPLQQVSPFEMDI